MKAYYKKSNGKVVELEQKNYLYLWSKNIVELIIPDGCRIVECSNNQLTDFIIPDGCKAVRCDNNQLTELIIPDGCESVWCYNNQLKELIIPDGCTEVVADMKSMTELNKVKELNLWI